MVRLYGPGTAGYSSNGKNRVSDLKLLIFFGFFEVGEGRLTHQHMGVDDGESGTPRKKGRVSVRLPRKRVVASQFQPADVSAVTQVVMHCLQWSCVLIKIMDK